jgi:hypothetical protein
MCGAESLVHLETQPLRETAGDNPDLTAGRVGLSVHPFPVFTYPKHDHRMDANGTETYVVWERCKVALLFERLCPDADVVLKASSNDGATWSPLTCLGCGAQDQFFPAIRTDRSRQIVNIAYYSSGSDSTFQRRVRVLLAHINPGASTPDPVTDHHTITTLLNDLSGDFLAMEHRSGIGHSIGVAARGTGVDGQSRAYVHYTYNNIQGVYNGQRVPDPNNHLSRFDY